MAQAWSQMLCMSMMIKPVFVLEVREDMNIYWSDQKEGTWLAACLW
jgi:hypothetical protein